MNISGHRMSTTEIESALVSHPKVAEAAVVGATDETTGQAIVAFVILRSDAGDGGPDVVKELRNHVAKEISPIAKPRQIMVVEELPKTRSGKIMRRLLRDIAENRELGDVTTLTDSSVMNLIKENLGPQPAQEMIGVDWSGVGDEPAPRAARRSVRARAPTPRSPPSPRSSAQETVGGVLMLVAAAIALVWAGHRLRVLRARART